MTGPGIGKPSGTAADPADRKDGARARGGKKSKQPVLCGSVPQAVQYRWRPVPSIYRHLIRPERFMQLHAAAPPRTVEQVRVSRDRSEMIQLRLRNATRT
jgi:hypothetical protein